jgi:Zn-dependent peptidase ImmA (M78 family)
MYSYIAQPTSRNSIRQLVDLIRNSFGLSNEIFFPVVHFLEYGLTEIDENFSYEIVPIEEMRGRYAETYPEQSKIVIREDVYNGAVNGVPRDRFTIAHEIGHFILHRPDNIVLARGNRHEKVPAFKDPEWQANTFAGELLAPSHIIRGMSPEEISKNCGVSITVGKIQSKNI